MRSFLFYCLLIISSSTFCQQSSIDSLKTVLNRHTKQDTTMVDLLNDIAFKTLFTPIDSALQYSQIAIKIAEKLNYQKGIASSYRTIGIYNSMRGHYTEALKHYQQSLKIEENLGITIRQTSVLNNIGILFMQQGDFVKATDYYEKGLIIAQKLNSELDIAKCMNNIGICYNQQEQYDKALEYYLNALPIFEKNSMVMNVASCLNSIGGIYASKGDYKTALIYFDKTFKIIKNTESIDHTCALLYNMAQTSFLDGKSNKALNYLHKSFKVADDNNLTARKKDIHALYCDIYVDLQNFEKAYYNLDLLKQLSDSLLNEDQIKELTTIENQYNFDKEKQQIELEQAKKDAVQESKIQQERYIKNIFIGAFSIFFILAFFILQGFIQKRKDNKILTKQKAEIEKINIKLTELDRFKETMTGMIVHDLKNPLNAIISQAKSTDVKYHANSMLSMVMNILDIQKFEDASMKIMPEKNLLFESINDAINQIMIPAQQKNIHIANTINSDLMILADRNLIDRVITNLLSNAIKYTPNNGKVVLIAKDEGDEYIKIMIEDNGTGIPKNKQIMIFEKFGQLDPKSLGTSQSTGLGLTFCKMAVEAHGGNIGVESDGESGTVFWFTLKKEKSNIQKPFKATNTKGDSNNPTFDIPLLKIQLQINQLQSTKYYEISNIRKILSTLPKDDMQIDAWHEEVLKAASSGNEDYYNKLIDIKDKSN